MVNFTMLITTLFSTIKCREWSNSKKCYLATLLSAYNMYLNKFGPIISCCCSIIWLNVDVILQWVCAALLLLR